MRVRRSRIGNHRATPTRTFVQQPLGGNKFVVARYNANGSLDADLDADGKVITDVGGTNGARTVVVQPDGKILAAGDGTTPSNVFSTTLVRYNPDGSPDAGFGT